MPPKEIELGKLYTLFVDSEPVDPSATSVIEAKDFRTADGTPFDGIPFNEIHNPQTITLEGEWEGKLPKSWFTTIELHRDGIERHGHFSWRYSQLGKRLRRLQYKRYTKIAKRYKKTEFITSNPPYDEVRTTISREQK